MTWLLTAALAWLYIAGIIKLLILNMYELEDGERRQTRFIFGMILWPLGVTWSAFKIARVYIADRRAEKIGV